MKLWFGLIFGAGIGVFIGVTLSEFTKAVEKNRKKTDPWEELLKKSYRNKK